MADTVQTIPVPTSDEGALREILRPRNSSNTSGFQRAHIIGRAFINREMQWLANLFGPNGADNALNGVLLPEGNRGGMLLGVAEHFGNDVDTFNALFYDAEDPESSKFLNQLEIERAEALDGVGDPNERARINKEYRVQARNFLDFVKIQFLHQDILDNIEIDGNKPSGLKSLALNSSDARFQSAAEVTSNLNSLAGNFDVETVEDNEIFTKMENAA